MQFPDTLIRQMDELCPLPRTAEQLVALSAEVDEFGDPQGPDGVTFLVDRKTGTLTSHNFDDSLDGDDFLMFIPAGRIIDAADGGKTSGWADVEALVRDAWNGMLAQEYFWYAFSCPNEQTMHGHGTEYEAMSYLDLLNEEREDAVYSARRLDDSEAEALGLDDHEDSFEIDEAIEDLTSAEDEED